MNWIPAFQWWEFSEVCFTVMSLMRKVIRCDRKKKTNLCYLFLNKEWRAKCHSSGVIWLAKVSQHTGHGLCCDWSLFFRWKILGSWFKIIKIDQDQVAYKNLKKIWIFSSLNQFFIYVSRNLLSKFKRLRVILFYF